MSRPETTKDVKERMIRVGTMDLERIIITPVLLKHYTGFIEAVEKLGGETNVSYGTTVAIDLPRNDKQLEAQLRSEQYEWDDNEKEYKRALKGDEADPVKEYKRDRVKEWAKAEGLPDPFDCFAANDEELQRIRQEMGME